eukprot:jgi/Botrbrau1/1181/Bobra.0162s0063.2
MDRIRVISFGCLVWGLMTATIGISTTIYQAMLWSAANGFGLALVIPCVSSLVADYNPSEVRGQAFGLLGLTAGLGGMAGAFFATNVSHYSPFGMEGWRFAFHLVAVLSICLAFLLRAFASDPRDKERDYWSSSPSPELGSAREVQGRWNADQSFLCGVCRWQIWRDIYEVLRVRSVQIIVLQGIVGTMPWVAMVFFTLWVQLLGFSDLQASILMAVFGSACSIGGVLGGNLGDYMMRVMGDRGRIVICQISVISSFPLSLLLLKGLPIPEETPSLSVALLYALVLFLMGLFISWNGANNSAMFSELVPVDLRSTVYAFDRCFEGAVGACAAPLVGYIAETFFWISRLDWGTVQPERQHYASQGPCIKPCCLLAVPLGSLLLLLHWLVQTFSTRPTTGQRRRNDITGNVFRQFIMIGQDGYIVLHLMY